MNDDDAIPRRGRDADAEPAPADAGATRAPGARPPPPPPPAPTSRVPRPLRWLADDLGLKLLALILAVSTWALVRNTQLKTTEVVTDVSVEIESTPPDVRILPGGNRTMKLTLEGTTGSVRRARAQLEQAGRRIKLRVHDLKVVPDVPYAEFADVDDFVYPLENKQLVAKVEPPIRVYWTRIASIELVLESIRLPSVEKTGKYVEPAAGFPAFDAPKSVVTVTGPIELIETLRAEPKSLFPDAVDAQAWLKLNPDLTTLYPFTSGFGQWRAADPESRTEALVTISPATVAAKLKLRETKSETVKADVAWLYPPGIAANAYDAFEVRILDPGYDARTRKLDIVVKGEPSLVADRKSQTPGWTLTIALPAPPADGTPNLDNASAIVRLVPPPGDDLPGSEAKQGLRLVSPRTVSVSIVHKGP